MTTAYRQKRRRPRRLNQEPAAVTWAREKAGLNKRALAWSIGISEQLMNEIESGWRSATPANLIKIAEVLNCPVVVLERKRCVETLPCNSTPT
jgi:DNA-binding XRE family transcriptional regulator